MDASLKMIIDSIVDEINAMTQEELIADFEMHSDGAFSEMYREHGLVFSNPFPNHYAMRSNNIISSIKYGTTKLKLDLVNIESANETPFEMAA